MEKSAYEETKKLTDTVRENQNRIEELTSIINESAVELDDLIDKQRWCVSDALKMMSHNERYYRDTLHMQELGDNLALADIVRNYRQLKDALSARRDGKDLLHELGLKETDILDLYSRGSHEISVISLAKVPVLEANRFMKSVTSVAIKTIDKHKLLVNNNIRLSKIWEDRHYTIKTKPDTVQREIILSSLNSTRLKHKKYSAIKTELEGVS